MIARNINIDMLRVLFKEGVPISNIAIILDAAESEIHGAISQLRKKNPDEWPKRNKGYVGKAAKGEPPVEPPKEKVEIKSSFSPMVPPVEKVNSEVVTRMMTPEEIERLNNIGKQTTDSTGAKIPKTNRYFAQPQEKVIEKPIEEVVKLKKPEDLTKEIYLSLKEAGRKNTQIEREYNFRPNHIYVLLKEWQIPPSSKQHSKGENLEPTGIIALNDSKHNDTVTDQQAESKITDGENEEKVITPEDAEKEKEQPLEQAIADSIEPTDEQPPIEDSKGNELKTDVPADSLVQVDNANTYITIHLRLKGTLMNRFDQRQLLTNETDEFVTGIETRDLDFSRCASELFTLIQNFTYLVEAELQGLMPKGNVSQKVVEFFEHHNEKHLEKISGL